MVDAHSCVHVYISEAAWSGGVDNATDRHITLVGKLPTLLVPNRR